MRQPYSVDRFSQWVASLVFRERVVFEGQIREIIRQRDVVEHGLGQIRGIDVFHSEANFVLFRVDQADSVWRDLLHSHNILVRDLSRVPGLEQCLRVTIGSTEENRRFLAAMEEIATARRESEIFGTAGGDNGDAADHAV